MPPKLRIARATNDLKRISDMYRIGLGLECLAQFQGHKGFDGIILGTSNGPYHFEFTHEAGVEAPRASSPESLIVLYCETFSEWEKIVEKMTAAGFTKVTAHNPYWDQEGCSFEDPEGFRVVLCRKPWKL